MNGRFALMAASYLMTAPAVAEPLERFDFRQIEMGVPFSIALYASDESAANKAARAAYARIDQLEDMMSDFDPRSELMRLVRTSRPGRPVEVSPELLDVLAQARQLSCRTDGAFDVSVGPVVRLWRQARREKKLPDPEALAAALERVGWESIRLDEQAGTVELLKPDMLIDLGAIAPGYAADEALKVLREQGIPRAMVDASGDFAIGDPPPGRDGWRIGVAPLDDPEATPTHILELANRGVATSGDAYRFVEVDGVRYSHLVDPQTGLGLTRRSSVTVVAPDGAAADALASAVTVLGPERGLKLIEETEGTAALFVTVEGGERIETASRRFGEFVAGEPE